MRQDHWQIGLAQVDFTPAPGLPLMGNFRNDYAARGVHDPLCARGLVIRAPAGATVAILAVDLCMVSRANVARMRETIASQTDLEPDAILVAATHTHSGPAPVRLGSLPDSAPTAVDQFLRQATTAAVQASRQLLPTALVVGDAEETRLSFNRRLLCQDGKTHMNWEGLDPAFVVRAQGPIDPQVAVLGLRRERKLVGAMVNFGLHPAILAGDNWLYSADYPGYLVEAMRRIHGDAFFTAFVNGCCGNVNHIDYTDPIQGRGYKMTQRVGYMLAADATRALRTPQPVRGRALAVRRLAVELDRLLISEEQRLWAEQVMEKARTAPAKGQVDGLPDEHYARTWLTMYERQLAGRIDRVEVMLVRLGNVAIVGLPGEAFCELGLEIKRRSPADRTLVIELANDCIGYLPTREAFSQGGYEPTPGTTNYQPGAGERLVEAVVTELTCMFQG